MPPRAADAGAMPPRRPCRCRRRPAAAAAAAARLRRRMPPAAPPAAVRWQAMPAKAPGDAKMAEASRKAQGPSGKADAIAQDELGAAECRSAWSTFREYAHQVRPGRKARRPGRLRRDALLERGRAHRREDRRGHGLVRAERLGHLVQGVRRRRSTTTARSAPATAEHRVGAAVLRGAEAAARGHLGRHHPAAGGAGERHGGGADGRARDVDLKGDLRVAAAGARWTWRPKERVRRIVELEDRPASRRPVELTLAATRRATTPTRSTRTLTIKPNGFPIRALVRRACVGAEAGVAHGDAPGGRGARQREDRPSSVYPTPAGEHDRGAGPADPGALRLLRADQLDDATR